MRETYTAPSLETCEVRSESGFAASVTGADGDTFSREEVDPWNS